jgi:uncharacterized protein YjbI with pentapeptide repeats
VVSIEIKHRWETGKVLYTAEGASDVCSALGEAVKSRADLSGADLYGADLYGANLYGANLSGADLSGANLSGANLSGANLFGTKGIVPERCNDLLLLLDQPGKIRAYKLVTADGYGPFTGGIRYVIGETVEVPNASTVPAVQCAPGINVATLPWCLNNWQPGYRILIVEFEAADIAAIPVGDGKFRLHRCRVVGEKEIDPVALGLVKAEEEAA